MMDDMIKKIYIVAFMLALLFPLWGGWTDAYFELNGVSYGGAVSDYSLETILSGLTQSELNTYVENNIPGRNVLIKMRSQILYSIFGLSPNKNVVIGKDKYLFEPEYIYKELNLYPPADEAYYEDLICKLENLQELCENNGKELYIFITPSKAFFCKDKIPWQYNELMNEGVNNYSLLINGLQTSSLRYFDSHQYIVEHLDELDAPVFYPTGIHWSRPWGYRCAKEFAYYINENSIWNLGNLQQNIEARSEALPLHPDADLYNSLNLLLYPKGIQYYDSSLELEKEGEVPKVFYRGGSFMGQSLSELYNCGLFELSAHYENNYCFTKEDVLTFSNFNSYEEFADMDRFLSDADILILEVNEAAIPVMSWGFVDYVLEHPELVKNA